jgi:hypothetical protein
MFHGCTSLIQAPEELPATTLAGSCYRNMFYGCTSLTQAPELPATTLATGCYQYMFYGCKQLNEITTAQTSFNNCINWLSNVSQNGTFYCPSGLGTNDTIERGNSACPDGWSVVNTDTLCFTAEEDGSTIKISKTGSAPVVYLETSPTALEGSWSDYTVGSTITLANVGDKVYFRAKQDNNAFATGTSNYNKFVMTGKIAASGNINALLKTDGSVDDLSTRDLCYYNMFEGCTSLTQAPELPAETLAFGCYAYMFQGCTSLTKAPELPAETLAERCYYYMFQGCTSLTQAPELPAETLTERCYYYMFDGCTSLTKATELPAINLSRYCYAYMFQGCTSLTQAPELPAETLTERCYYYMFDGCSSLTQAPELPAETLAERCYYNMFNGCTNLNNINVNFSSWYPSSATTNWVTNVSPSGTFYCSSILGNNDTIERGISACPDGWSVVNV